MKFTITINQRAAVENFDIEATGLDMNDFALAEFAAYWGSLDTTRKTVENGRVWFWLKWDVVKKQMPLLGIKTYNTFWRRISKLIQNEFVIAHADNQTTGQAYYAMGVSWKTYSSSCDVLQKNNTVLQKSNTVLHESNATYCENAIPPIAKTQYNKTIEDKYTEDKYTSSIEDVKGKKNEKPIFDLRRELMQRNLHKVAEIAKMPNEQWYRLTLQNYSDAYFWELCERLNEWLKNKKGKPYTDFAKVFKDWALAPNGWEALKGLNDFWQKQYGAPYKEAGELGKGDKDAINAIGEFLNTKSIEKGSNWHSTLQEVAAVFFEKLPERWRNLSYFKLISIANDLPQIYAMITNPHTTSKQAIKEAEVIEAATEKYMQRKEAESQMPNAMEAISQVYTNILSKPKK